MAPSGVQKESLEPSYIFELNRNGSIKSPIKDLRLSECAPLFQLIFDMRDAGAVIHSHALECVLVSRQFDKEFTITNMEMIKGITGHKNTDMLIVPIIENTEKESQLKERLKMAVLSYPHTYAVLVRNHGIYIWGENWKKAKQYAECYHYLFAASIRFMELGLNTYSTHSYPRIWHMSEVKDQHDENRDWSKPLLTLHHIEKLGVKYKSLSGYQTDTEFQEIQKEYNYHDIVTVSKDYMKEHYYAMTEKFFEEHFHNDDEVRYILEGSGYFDIRDENNQWIRIQMGKGDLINLPAGLYHRFTTDRLNYIVAMRLFCGEPNWKALKPDDNNLIRKNYKKYIQSLHTPSLLF